MEIESKKVSISSFIKSIPKKSPKPQNPNNMKSYYKANIKDFSIIGLFWNKLNIAYTLPLNRLNKLDHSLLSLLISHVGIINRSKHILFISDCLQFIIISFTALSIWTFFQINYLQRMDH